MVVFSLLGTFSAFAIPRYTHLANLARAAQLLALSGLLRGVARSAYQQYVASGYTLRTAKLDGRTVALQNGVPEASTRGIRAAIIDWSGFVAQGLPNSVTFMKKGAEVAERCAAVTYAVPEPRVTAESTTEVAFDGC
jgi:type II secretory pathway pseudopilin PulG